ncbi:MAG: hypothetical protein GXO90_11760, partial [FCB group bacterium]|nr:hypothetical protein [FCB group bacterium]
MLLFLRTPGIVTHLNNNFDGYADDAAMKGQWYSWSYTSPGATVSYNLDTGTNGASGANSLLMKLDVTAGTVGSAPGTADPTGDASVVVFETTSGGLRGNLVRATAIKVWVNPEGFTSNLSDPFFRIGLAESSTIGGDRWISPRYYLKDINTVGEVLTIPIDSLSHYSGPDAVLDLTNISKLYLWLGYAGSTGSSSADSATILVDNIEVVVGKATDLVDDFELYKSNAQLQVYYPWVGAISGNTPAIALADSGGSDRDRALKIDFGFSVGDVDPWAYAGGPVAINARDWSAYKGIRLWVKGSTTGDPLQYIEIAVHEGDSTGAWGDKFSSPPIQLSALDPAGEYVFLKFDDFTRYSGYGGDKDDGVLDLTDIRSIFVFGKYSGAATQNSTASVYVDDIKLDMEPVVIIPPTPGIVTHLNNNFDGYANESAMKGQWYSWSYTDGATVSYNLDTGTNGASGKNSLLMKLDVTAGTVGSAPGTADPTGDAAAVVYETTDGSLRGNLVRATAIKIWVNPEGFTSNLSDPFFRIGLAESSTIGGDRWISPRYYLKDINTVGEVLTIPIDSLSHYSGSDAVLDLTNISKLYLWLGYEGSTGSSSDD